MLIANKTPLNDTHITLTCLNNLKSRRVPPQPPRSRLPRRPGLANGHPALL